MGWVGERFSGDEALLPEKDWLRRDHFRLITRVYLGKSMEKSCRFGGCRKFSSPRPARWARTGKSVVRPLGRPFFTSADLYALRGESDGDRRDAEIRRGDETERGNASKAPAEMAMSGKPFGKALPFWLRPGKRLGSDCRNGSDRESTWEGTAKMAMTGKVIGS